MYCDYSENSQLRLETGTWRTDKVIPVFKTNMARIASSHGLVVKAEGSWPRGLGLDPTAQYTRCM